MPFPNLTDVEVKQVVQEADDIRFLDRGGQKVVFACRVADRPFVLKFLRPNPRPLANQDPDASAQALSLDDVTARARREVATLKQCNTSHLVKIGPIELRTVKIGEEELLCFSEEFIDGAPIKNLITPNHPGLTNEGLVMLGLHVSEAIEALWTHRKIHRDIKPQNIMRRRADESFVVLDMGLVFDLDDESWSMSPVGTLMYFSPEQMDFSNRRQVLDFRSDLFSLGVTMYELGTGIHPFAVNAQNSWEVLNNIRNRQPTAPIALQPGIPEELSDIIMRLLAKRPALRYRRISMLRDALLMALQPGGS